MTTILNLKSSIFSDAGASSGLADAFVATRLRDDPRAQLIVRDLAADPVPHLTAERFSAFLAKPEARTPEQEAVVEYSDRLIDELKRADVIVLGLPMYNFGVPSMLKAYFDHIARAGVTFKYTANGSVGLLKGKKAYVFAARGGLYAGTALDTQTTYVRDFLNFVGISDVEFVYAEGLAIDAQTKEAALAKARQSIEQMSRLARLAA